MMNDLIAALRSAALNAVNPATAIDRSVKRNGDRLVIAERMSYDLADREIHCLALGKAALPMAQAISSILGSQIVNGLVVTNREQLGVVELPAAWTVLTGRTSHPRRAQFTSWQSRGKFLS